ncbi:hypothetical protein [Georgenia subflava]|uniref:Uncharacterized protein n=1 Tax=Georgenia subflava TaxID=1622177 RepID=A0A6N7EE64_9MICO|nr:hypothetical protein [Georgenia subflava]MPV36310.1 hypothetical protein [Georgenia subflava]
MADLPQARAAKEGLRARIRDRDGVVGVGIARRGDGYCLKVNVTTEDVATRVPSDIDGVEVRVRVVGRITAQA